MPGKAAKIVVTVRQLEVLQDIVHARTSSQGLVQRVRIILGAFDGLTNEQIAQRVQLDRHAVGLWRRRWKKAFERLVNAERSHLSGELQRTIAEVLADRPRPGRPATFTSEQIALILAVACESPVASGLPISHWTARELACEVLKRKIVERISARQVTRFLNAGEIRPHHQQHWLNPAPQDPKTFQAEVAKVCETYEKAGKRLKNENIHTISVDEKTGIQALEPASPNHPMQPGQDERRELESIRHGTQTAIVGMEVATGEIVTAHVGDTRTEEDFTNFIDAVVKTDPDAGFVFVADQLNTHMSEKLVLLVVMLCG